MNNIVIVEDRLGRGISLAVQFEEYSKNHPELEIRVLAICYFCANTKKAEEDIREKKDCGFDIRHVNLLNFSEIMDEYMNSKEKQTLLIMDYVLEGDGSDGMPVKRVNIRYARNNERFTTNKLWFYTGTGTENARKLSQLVGEEHVLEVLEVGDDNLRLDLENDNFKNNLAFKSEC